MSWRRLLEPFRFAIHATALAILVALLLAPLRSPLVPTSVPVFWSNLNEADARVGGLLDLDQVPPFSVIVGQSTALSDFDPEILARDDQSNDRYLVFWTEGGGIAEMHDLTRGLLRSRLRPATIVLAIHPTFLIENTIEPRSLEKYLPAKTPLRAALLDAGHELLRFDDARKWAHYRFLRATRALRERWFVWIGREEAFYPRAREPLSPTAFDPNDFVAVPSERLEAQWRHYETRAHFDRSSYVAGLAGRQGDALLEFVEQIHAMGARVLVVLLPEHSRLRRAVPADLSALIRTHLDSRPTTLTAELLDRRAALDDAFFADYTHLIPDGRRRFSERIAREIRRSP